MRPFDPSDSRRAAQDIPYTTAPPYYSLLDINTSPCSSSHNVPTRHPCVTAIRIAVYIQAAEHTTYGTSDPYQQAHVEELAKRDEEEEGDAP